MYITIDEKYDLECSVTFEIEDKNIYTITGYFEPCNNEDYSYGE